MDNSEVSCMTRYFSSLILTNERTFNHLVEALPEEADHRYSSTYSFRKPDLTLHHWEKSDRRYWIYQLISGLCTKA